MASRELFVWYRVRREHAAQARAAVGALQQSLCAQWPGLQARLLVREGNDASTWMETYARPLPGTGGDRGIDDSIEAAIARAARSIEPLLEGARHVEAFTLVS